MRVTTIGVMVVVLSILTGHSVVLAQSGAARFTTCQVGSDALAVSATVRQPYVILEIELVLQNGSASGIQIDPSRFALYSDQGELNVPLSAEQAAQLIRNPTLDVWAWFWVVSGNFGVAVGVGGTSEQVQRVDTRMLRPTELLPGASVKGSLYFRSPNPRVNLFTLSLEGMAAAGERLAPVRLNCEMPRPPASGGAAAAPAPAMKTITMNARAAVGPLIISVPALDFAKDFTAVMLSIENSADVEANLFAVLLDTKLIDDTGRAYAVRPLRSELPARVPARGSVRGRLVFEPLPLPPAIRVTRLTMPEVRVGDAVYDIQIELRF